MNKLLFSGILLLAFSMSLAQDKPNVLIIYTDDLGMGDVGIYGAKGLETPNIDALAAQGIRFTNAHATASTCTPSRFSLMTGKYPFRQTGTGILPGDARLIVPTDEITLPKVFKKAGYTTAIVGKWHLGLGESVNKNWNQPVAPGPKEVGFDYSFIFPATADRVPTIFLENQEIVGGDPGDPVEVSYEHPVGDDPTGKSHPELLKLHSSPNQGHNQTIVNGIGRIGWMAGGKQARWNDEELSFTFARKVCSFITEHSNEPFFMMYCATEPHVPRMPATMFKGKSGLGLRGDAILQLDYTVGQIVSELKAQGIYENTLIIFSSDNGPVLDDGYQDGAVSMLGDHDPFLGFRGGKYSAFEAGSRIPFIVSSPLYIKQNQTSDALISQVDLLRSFAAFLGIKLNKSEAIDSQNMMDVLLGKSQEGRQHLITRSATYALIFGDYKYIHPHKGPSLNKNVNIETGYDLNEQLYNLAADPAEQENLAIRHPEIVEKLQGLLEKELKPAH